MKKALILGLVLVFALTMLDWPPAARRRRQQRAPRPPRRAGHNEGRHRTTDHYHGGRRDHHDFSVCARNLEIHLQHVLPGYEQHRDRGRDVADGDHQAHQRRGGVRVSARSLSHGRQQSL